MSVVQFLIIINSDFKSICPTSFPGSLFSASFVVNHRDPGNEVGIIREIKSHIIK